MSTTSTKDNKYIRVMDQSFVVTRSSAERNKYSNKDYRKWSNDRLKNELSSLIAEFSYLTDVSAKTSKEKYQTSEPSYHVYAADTTPVSKGPFTMSSRSDYADTDERNEKLVKTVEWDDNLKRKGSSHWGSHKKYNKNSHISRKGNFGTSRHDRNLKKSRSIKRENRTNNEQRKIFSRSLSRSKYKSPKKSSQRNPKRSQKSRAQTENKYASKNIRVSSSHQAVKGPRKSRSNQGFRRVKSRSPSNIEMANKKSRIKKIRVSSFEYLEEGGKRPRKYKSKTKINVVEKQYIPIGRRKKSKPFYKGFYPFRYDRKRYLDERKGSPVRYRSKSWYKDFHPFRYEGKKDKKVVKRRRSIPVIRKYEVVDSIPSEDATILTIYPQMDPKNLESKVEPVFLTDETLPCKCFQCMRKYKSFAKISKVQSPPRKKQPKAFSCTCKGTHVVMDDYQDVICRTRKPQNSMLLKYPCYNMTCDFGTCAMSESGIPQREVIKRYFEEISYPYHDDGHHNCFCHQPINYLSSETESGYITERSVRSIYFKFNCYAHHVDSTITRHFHSILGRRNVC